MRWGIGIVDSERGERGSRKGGKGDEKPCGERHARGRDRQG